MKKIWMPAMLGSLMLVMLAASPVFASYSMGGAEPGGKDDPGPPLYYVVQFEGPIQQEWKDQVTQRGGELLGYIPYFAFKVRMNPAQAQKIEELDSAARVHTYPSRAKLSRNLILEDGPNFYRIRVERGADAGMVAAAIARTDARILRRDGKLMLILAEGSEVQALANILDIALIESFKFPEKHNEYGAGVIMGANTANNSGYDGSTQIVAVADTGLGDGTKGGAHADIPAGRIKNIYSRSAPDSIFCYDVVQDGPVDVDSGHGTHVAVSLLGDGGPSGEGKGTAPAAKLVFQAVEEYLDLYGTCEGVLPDGYYFLGIPEDIGVLFRQAYNAKARIHSNSWGANWFGEYTVDSANADEFIWTHPDMTITFSAGNDGVDANIDGLVDTCTPGGQGIAGCLLASPATAKNVITVGASENVRADYACDPRTPAEKYPDLGCPDILGKRFNKWV